MVSLAALLMGILNSLRKVFRPGNRARDDESGHD